MAECNNCDISNIMVDLKKVLERNSHLEDKLLRLQDRLLATEREVASLRLEKDTSSQTHPLSAGTSLVAESVECCQISKLCTAVETLTRRLDNQEEEMKTIKADINLLGLDLRGGRRRGGDNSSPPPSYQSMLLPLSSPSLRPSPSPSSPPPPAYQLLALPSAAPPDQSAASSVPPPSPLSVPSAPQRSTATIPIKKS